MNRSYYFNYIEQRLSELSYRIKNRGKINLLDLNIYSETFFARLVNILFDYEFKNLNVIKQNTEAIDLVDHKNKIIAQVSSTCTKQKIQNSLDKEIFKDYSGYQFIFVAIAGDADNLKDKTFVNPYKARFVPAEDIYDIKSLLNIILGMEIKKQRELFQFLKDELGNNIDIVKVDTNLATLINILAKEDLASVTDSPEINSFQILKKIEYNDLLSAQSAIDDYKIYYSRVDEKYKEFDKQGANKSLSVLAIIRSQYIKISKEKEDSVEVFFTIIDNVVNIVKKSKNYIEIPYEELELCASILVVDAFIRCKIFKNPEGYSHVTT